MLTDSANLDLVYRGFKKLYGDAFLAAPANGDKIVMKVPSTGASEQYSWLGSFPAMREWIGPRVAGNLDVNSFTIINRMFESTVRVSRNQILDDKIGVFAPVFQRMGINARLHPEELIFGLLRSGFVSNCYDGQFFFDVDHPVIDPTTDTVINVSNMQAGAGPSWYLLDTSQAIKPLIWQEREPYTFEQQTSPGDDAVFMNNDYTYGVRARVNAGYGLWQLAFGSRAALTAANYAAARAAMMAFRSDTGRFLGINPNTLVVPPALESDARGLLNTEIAPGGAASNVWKNTAELIVTPFVA